MAQKSTYSFKDVKAAITGPGGAISLGDGAGAAEEGISVDPNGEMDIMTIGADGSGQHSLSADRSGRVSVRLLKTSPTNALLSTMLAFQRASGGSSHGQNTIVITDVNRGDVITCRQAAFSKVPALTYAREAGMVEWEFNVIQIDVALGGL